MAELPRARGRDQIWLTRSHLGALAVMTVMVAALTFFIGLELGRRGTLDAAPPAALPLTPDADRQAELEALLREAAQKAPSNDLRFPTELPSGTATAPDMAIDPTTDHATRIPSEADAAVDPPAPPGAGAPTKGWAVQIASYNTVDEADARVAELREIGLSAYQVASLVDGANAWRVRVGGYADEAAASAAASTLAAQLHTHDLTVTRAP